YAIQWHMIQYALPHGYTLYNFYGTSGIFDESAEDYGVYKFKRGFGGNVVELIGTFVLPVHKFWYFLYTQLKKIRR
ncbi:MAG: peptidoglycan bridge formation glycyltransferase FemA/FemB family protein, partial [Erysipelotrichaceae bacterium]|nr:peptidoglycan bridge formation glycyltransferase FemA/FemB family protein [Erysipelotrichaceae bacterium]